MFLIILHNLLTCLPPLFGLTNTLLYPLGRIRKYTVFGFFILTYSILNSLVPGLVSMIALAVAWAVIAVILPKHAFINILSSFIGYLVSVCVDYFIIFICSLFGFSVESLNGNFQYYILFCAVLSMMIYATTYYAGKFMRFAYFDKLHLDSSNSLSPRIKALIFLEVAVCVVIFIVNIIYWNYFNFPNKILIFNGIIYFVLFVSTAVIITQIIHVITKETELAAKLKSFENMQDYTRRVENLYVNIRTFKHDYINILSTMEIFFKNKRYDELEAYFHDTIFPSGQLIDKEDAILARLSNIVPLELKGLIYPKLLSALNEDMNITVDIPEAIKGIDMNILDLVRIVGIFLDNAIEAALETKSKLLYIGFIENDSVTIIRIQNSSSCPPNLKTLTSPGVTTKTKGHGLGLYSVSQILKECPNIVWNTDYKEGLFTQQLNIYPIQ